MVFPHFLHLPLYLPTHLPPTCSLIDSSSHPLQPAGLVLYSSSILQSPTLPSLPTHTHSVQAAFDLSSGQDRAIRRILPYIVHFVRALTYSQASLLYDPVAAWACKTQIFSNFSSKTPCKRSGIRSLRSYSGLGLVGETRHFGACFMHSVAFRLYYCQALPPTPAAGPFCKQAAQCRASLLPLPRSSRV